MNTSPIPLHERAGYELRFQSISDEGRAYAFPCDAAGHVDIDALNDKARLNYLYARTLIGREFSRPAVRPRATEDRSSVRKSNALRVEHQAAIA